MASAGILAMQGSLVCSALAVAIAGFAMAHGLELQHQCLHGTAFRSIWANRGAGVIFGLPMLVSFKEYREAHMQHHALVGTDKDHGFFDYGDAQRRLSVKTLAVLFGLPRLREVFRFILRGAFSRRTSFDAMLLLALPFGLLMISFVVGSAMPLVSWLLALILVAEPAHFLIELPEHFLCDSASRSPFRNTRTVVASPFAVWFTNYNNFHVEHHLRPSMPFDQLPVLHRSIRARLRHLDQGYASFFARAIVNLRWQMPHAKEPNDVR